MRRLPPAPIALLLLALAVPATAQEYPDLRECHDPELQEDLDAVMGRLPNFWSGVRSREVGGILADVTDLSKPKLAWYNPEMMMYAASLPKIGIVLGALVEIENGNLELDDETHKQLVRMVKVSSNRDASAVLRKVGIERLAEILQDPKHGALYDPAYGGGIWVGKAYDKSPVWKRDPINNISHGASAMQAARFYYGVLTGTLVDRDYLPLLGEMFGEPGVYHKFVKGLKGRKGVQIYRKSGTWREYHSDSGVIWRDEFAYIVVALDRNPDGGMGLVRGIKVIDDLMIERNGGAAAAR